MRVRQARADDLDALCEMGERMRRESLIEYPPIEPDFVLGFLRHQETDDSGLAVFIAESDRPAGFMACMTAHAVFSRETFAVHHILYVVPEKRGSTAAIRLIGAFEGWAEKHGIRRKQISVDTGLAVERTGRFYERLGYTHIGGSYRKDL